MFNEICKLLCKYTRPDIVITPEASLTDELALTSLDIANFIVDLEDKYDIEVNEHTIQQIITVDDIIRFLESQ